MAEDFVSFILLSLSSMLIIVNPLSSTLIYVSLTSNLDKPAREVIAKESCPVCTPDLAFRRSPWHLDSPAFRDNP